MKKPIANDIRSARLAAGLTQQQAADLIGYSRRSIQEWESGRRHLRGFIFEVLVNAINNTKNVIN